MSYGAGKRFTNSTRGQQVIRRKPIKVRLPIAGLGGDHDLPLGFYCQPVILSEQKGMNRRTRRGLWRGLNRRTRPPWRQVLPATNEPYRASTQS